MIGKKQLCSAELARLLDKQLRGLLLNALLIIAFNQYDSVLSKHIRISKRTSIYGNNYHDTNHLAIKLQTRQLKFNALLLAYSIKKLKTA